jgi:hypothetical protein
MGIECKIVSVDKGATELYLSQHLTVDKKGIHQIEQISNYLEKTGRRGYLALELRMGVGHSRRAYLIQCKAVEKLYLTKNLKITLDVIRTYPEMKRSGSLYIVSYIILEKEQT